MTPDAVVFDVGNVLVDWDPEGYYDRAIGRIARTRLFREVPLHDMNARIDAGAPWQETVAWTAEENPRWRRDILSWRDHWEEMIGPVIEDSAALLAALRHRGVPVFALTNFGRETFDRARELFPVLREFDGAVVSGHVGVLKPDPEIYRLFEERSSLVPERLLYTDDRPENIAAAEARGWHTHLFEGPRGLGRRLVVEGLLREEDLPSETPGAD